MGEENKTMIETQEEYEIRMRKKRREISLKETKREQEEAANAIESIPSWIKRGYALIFPERYNEWVQCVSIRATDIYHGMDLEAALEIMEALEKGASMEDAKKILANQDHSPSSESMVRNIVLSFSSKGLEFWEATVRGEISPESKNILEAKKKENIKLTQTHDETDTKGKHI